MADSHWRKATASRVWEIEEALICPKCHETNVSGTKHLVTLDVRSWTANCSVCAYGWPVNEDGEPRRAS